MHEWHPLNSYILEGEYPVPLWILDHFHSIVENDAERLPVETVFSSPVLKHIHARFAVGGRSKRAGITSRVEDTSPHVGMKRTASKSVGNAITKSIPHNRIFTNKQATWIRARHRDGERVREIADDYGVSTSVILDIVNFINYRNA